MQQENPIRRPLGLSLVNLRPVRNRIIIAWLAGLILVFLAVGCARIFGGNSAKAIRLGAPGGGAADAAPIPARVPESNLQVQFAAESSAEPARSGGVAPVAAEPALAGPEASARRRVIYTATLRLLVANRDAARAQIDEVIRRMGGFVQNSSLEHVAFRVPPANFEATLNELGAAGQVTERNINSADVTAEYTDLQLRIEVAEGSRKRLMAMLENARETSAILEIERDIRRLTEEIESLKGSLRVMDDRIEWATITVWLGERSPEPKPTVPRRAGSVFAWINELGVDGVMADVGADAPLNGGSLGGWLALKTRGPRWALGGAEAGYLPSGYVPLLLIDKAMLGTTAKDDRVRVIEFRTRQNATLEHWMSALHEEFAEGRGYLCDAPVDFPLTQRGLRAGVLRARTSARGLDLAYAVWLVQVEGDPRRLVAIESVCKSTVPGEQRAKLEEAIRGIVVR